ncbi:hypothetical protein D3C81_1976330 [compost metagenome]
MEDELLKQKRRSLRNAAPAIVSLMKMEIANAMAVRIENQRPMEIKMPIHLEDRDKGLKAPLNRMLEKHPQVSLLRRLLPAKRTATRIGRIKGLQSGLRKNTTRNSRLDSVRIGT